ncbi:MAG: hypothetical protein ACTSQP_24570 [Promethearchaeota archaeon]
MKQRVYEITKEMETQIKSQGVLTCPECKGLMKLLKVDRPVVRTEFYCEKCHISVPLYK